MKNIFALLSHPMQFRAQHRRINNRTISSVIGDAADRAFEAFSELFGASAARPALVPVRVKEKDPRTR